MSALLVGVELTAAILYLLLWLRALIYVEHSASGPVEVATLPITDVHD